MTTIVFGIVSGADWVFTSRRHFQRSNVKSVKDIGNSCDVVDREGQDCGRWDFDFLPCTHAARYETALVSLCLP